MNSDNDNTYFEIESDISKSLKNILNYVDNYQLNIFIDFISDTLTIVGISPTKSVLVAIKKEFNTISSSLDDEYFYNFACKIPKFNCNKYFKIIKDGDNILMGNESLKKVSFYTGNLYTDWDGTGWNLYDHQIKINTDNILKIIKLNDNDVIFKVDKDNNVSITFGNVTKNLGKTHKSKNNSDNLKYYVSSDDLIESLNAYKKQNISIFLNKNCPIIIKNNNIYESIIFAII